ncbi:zinc finger CCCH domain-containing protein 15-like [Andrographis paniculata]|uniref:zinc finger CCCH domain-containing protein 15-like n=1 Tax=Andrographis paniculata TaxID=175694 RepID=UPI0021E95F5F|nr:zinc finger CCCH domain-containing protein 15-like [Andrographis paniculata]
MQRENSISSHSYPTVNVSSSDYDFPASLYHSLMPKQSPVPDYSNDISTLSLPWLNGEALPSGFPQIQQQRLRQDFMYRHRGALCHLQDVAQQAQALRQENVNLKVTNLDLNNRLNLMLNPTSFHSADLSPDLDSVLNGMRKITVGGSEEGEIEVARNRPAASVVDSSPNCLQRGGVERFHLPKSISVRSSGYLKASRAARNCVKQPANQSKIDNGTQRVYVKGVKKEQAVELEVYNQGMFKTELCNKWQHTGTCPYGNNCQFAHGIEELRPVLRHPRYKTEVCRMVLNGIPCPYGHRCHFRHTLTDQEQLTRTAMISNTHSAALLLPPNYHQ